MTLKSLLIAALFCCSTLYSQETSKSLKCVKKVQKLFDKFDYHGAIDLCTECLEKSPNSAQLYYERGLLHHYLNHAYASAADFEKSLDLGIITPGFQDELFMRWKCDTMFIIKEITDSLIFPELKPELNYKREYGLADSLQGMLRTERTCFDVNYEKLTVRIHSKSQSISGSNEIFFTAKQPSKKIQIDLYSHYSIRKISMNDVDLKYERIHNAIFIEMPEELKVDSTYSVLIKYRGEPRNAPNPPWNGGFVWEKNGDRDYIGVACEHLGASSWWPNKDHLSDKPDSMEINIQTLAGYDAIANGNLLSETKADNGFVNFQWKVSYPINSYNVTFYIGDFVNFNESYKNKSGENVQVDYYVLEENLEKAKKYYSGTTRILEVFEDIFGEYNFPKDGLAYVESPFAGMEHQSAIAIGGDYGKDSIYSMIGKYDFLVIHETAHEWWGNAVAVADMADIWISEGFATYAEHLFIEEEFGRGKYLDEVGANMVNINNIWPMVGQRDVNDNAFQGQDVYYKGAAMLHSLRCIYDNDKEFIKMIKLFYHRSKNKTSSTDDFTRHAQSYTNKRLAGFFDVFLYQSSPPTLEYAFDLRGGKFRLQYRWINVPEYFEMPFLIVFNGFSGFRIEATTELKEIGFDKVSDFYLFNPNDMDSRVNTKNAFTYYFAKNVKFKDH